MFVSSSPTAAQSCGKDGRYDPTDTGTRGCKMAAAWLKPGSMGNSYGETAARVAWRNMVGLE